MLNMNPTRGRRSFDIDSTLFDTIDVQPFLYELTPKMRPTARLTYWGADRRARLAGWPSREAARVAASRSRRLCVVRHARGKRLGGSPPPHLAQ